MTDAVMQIFKEITEIESVNERHPFVKGDNLTNTARWNTVRDIGCRPTLVLFTLKSHKAFECYQNYRPYMTSNSLMTADARHLCSS